MIDKFHTIEELKDTGLKMIGSCISDHDIPAGEKYLKPRVISQWDFSDYTDFYVYSDKFRMVVEICVRTDEKTTRSEKLKKDLSNL